MAVTVQVEREEVEPQVQMEIDVVISDAESMIRDTLGAVDIEETETGPQPERVYLWRHTLR